MWHRRGHHPLLALKNRLTAEKLGEGAPYRPDVDRGGLVLRRQKGANKRHSVIPT